MNSYAKRMDDFYSFVKKENLGSLATDVSFKSLSSYKVGGNIHFTYLPRTIDDLIAVYRYLLTHNIRVLIIGNGSNILPSDNYYDGVVILLDLLPKEVIIEENEIEVTSNYLSNSLAYNMARKNIGGLEYLASIPGTIGGAIYMNSGTHNRSISESIVSVKVVDEKGEVRNMLKEELVFGYRKSSFMNTKYLILSCVLQVLPNVRTLDLINRRKYLKEKTQPLNYHSCGSVFKNEDLKAWEIVDKLNLRGYQIGDAKISDLHANFIINLGKAKSNDIKELIELVKRRASEELGLRLTEEVIYINF